MLSQLKQIRSYRRRLLGAHSKSHHHPTAHIH